jgi:hypothetical protein
VLRSTSHPSPGSPLQSAYPALHTYWQAPSEHPVAVMCAGAWSAHTYPHAPQLAALVLTSVSHPSVVPAFRSALQSFQPVSHVCWQLLALQIGAECAGRSSHTTLHPPQLSTSLAMFVSHPLRLVFSLALQSAYPALHTMLHWLVAQVGVPFTVLHGKLHAPQCAVLVRRSVSHPAAAVQSPYPELHAPI